MFLEQLKIEFKVYLRQPLYLIFSVFMPLISFAIFGSIYGHMNYGNVDFFSQYIPSFCVIILFSSSVYNVGNQVVSDKEKGIYKRLRVTPIKLWKIILALVLKAMIISMISYILIILFAVFYFKISMPNLITFSVIYAFAVIYSLILGVGLGIIINRINTYSGVLMMIFIPLFILSDAMMPISIFPKWMQTLANYNPLYRLNIFLRYFWNTASNISTEKVLFSITYLSIFMVIFLINVGYRWNQGQYRSYK